MKRFSVEALALAALLAGCGKEGDPTCKEGEYLVNGGLSCCPVGTEFKLGLCEKPEATPTPTASTEQKSQTTSISQEATTAAQQSDPTTEVPATPPPQVVQPPPTTTQPPQPPAQPPTTTASQTQAAPEPTTLAGTWLFAFTTTGDTCSTTPQIGMKWSLAVTISEPSQDGTFSMAALDTQPTSVPGCVPGEYKPVVGTLTATGIFAASGKAVFHCVMSSEEQTAYYLLTGKDQYTRTIVTATYSHNGKLAGATLTGTRQMNITTDRDTLSDGACFVAESFTATK